MEKRPYVVAIAGGTCSGKSTLTDRLEAYFSPLCQVKVFHMDGYFKKNPPTTIAPITRKEYVEHNHPETLELDRLYQDCQEAAAEEMCIRDRAEAASKPDVSASESMV